MSHAEAEKLYGQQAERLVRAWNALTRVQRINIGRSLGLVESNEKPERDWEYDQVELAIFTRAQTSGAMPKLERAVLVMFGGTSATPALANRHERRKHHRAHRTCGRQ